MNIIYDYSRWNDLSTNSQYHKKPTQKELKRALKDGKALSEEGATIFVHKDQKTVCGVILNYVAVQMTIGNSLTSNRYTDVYSITAPLIPLTRYRERKRDR